MYIVVLNVLYDEVYMDKSLQIKFLFRSKIFFQVIVLLGEGNWRRNDHNRQAS